MEKVNISVIGAGVVGLAVVEILSRNFDGDIVVFEKNDKFGQETSSRNSEVIHAGIYYPKESLKSKLCLKGNRMLYEFCRENDINHKKCGKLIVSISRKEAEKIEAIYANAVSVGVPELKLLSEEEIKELEPKAHGLNGIFSGSTGIIDSHGLMEYLYRTAKENGVMFAFGSEITGLKKANGNYIIKTAKAEEVLSDCIINCAGLNSDQVAAMAGFDIQKFGYRIHYCKGDYFSVTGSKGKLRHLVYPVPHEEGVGLGVHATLDLQGYIRLGPDDTFVNGINYDVDVSKKSEFFKFAKDYLPWLIEDSLMPDTSGIRPKLQGPGDGFRDFVIKEESDKDFPGFINLIGIESPGLTASLAIGEHVLSLIKMN